MESSRCCSKDRLDMARSSERSRPEQKCSPRAAQDDDAAAAVLGLAQGEGQLLDHGGGERVTAFRTVECNGEDAAGFGLCFFDEDRCVVRRGACSFALVERRFAPILFIGTADLSVTAPVERRCNPKPLLQRERYCFTPA